MISLMRPFYAFFASLFLLGAGRTVAQENLVPLPWNLSPMPSGSISAPAPALKTTALSLPFFEDFLGAGPYPDGERWAVNRQVYINNTMGFNPISQGVCTFDALGAGNRPYDTVNPFRVRYADTLASQSFDLSAYSPGDSIYLSFFYQPQGTGFSPEATDSLLLFFRTKNGRWFQQWGKEGSLLQPFRQVMIPVADSAYLYNGFRFRFINKASINLNDDVWNLDYIRMDAGRSQNDTAVNDVALTTFSGNILQDYTAMPYRHYRADPAGLTVPQINGNFRNNSAQSVSGFMNLNASNAKDGSTLYITSEPVTIGPYQTKAFQIPPYQPSAPVGPQEALLIRQRFSLQTSASQATRANDTLTQFQIFDNYFAYDDGSAEKAYFLNLLPALPGKVAIEFRTLVADTLRGAGILFGQQVPSAANKFFNMEIYRKLAGVAGATADELIHSQDFYQPRFIDTVNRFYNYTFAAPVVLPPGTYYFCVMQPALSGSDSLYYAVDVNRIGSNHLYYNVDGNWRNSSIDGALMIRPLFGGPVIPSGVEAVAEKPSWSVFPNPSTGAFSLQGVPAGSRVQLLYPWSGSVVREWRTPESPALPNLSTGMYLVRWQAADGLWSTPQKWVLTN